MYGGFFVDPVIVISIVGVVVFMLLLIGAPLKPIKLIGNGMIKLLIGALFLFFLNTFGTTVNIHIPINTITTIVSGFLGIPGVAALVIIKYLILP